MANLWCDGFRRYGGSVPRMLEGKAWAQVDVDDGHNGWELSTANPRTGTHHLRLTDDSTNKFVRRVFGAPKQEVFYGQAINLSSLPQFEPNPDIESAIATLFLAQFRDQANNVHLSVVLGTDGAIVVYRGGIQVGLNFIGSLIYRSEPCIFAGAYQHLEHYVLGGNAYDGAYELRVDEVTVLNLPDINTYSNTGSLELSQVVMGRMGGYVFDGGSDTFDVADVFANDTSGTQCNDFIGDCKSFALMPNADTAEADFTPSAGVTQYGVIDEVGPNDSDYLSLAAASGLTEVGFESLPANASEVLVARPFLRAKKDDAGTCTIKPGLQTNGDVASETEQPVTTAFAYYDEAIHLNPDTGAPYTPAELNASKLRLERFS